MNTERIATGQVVVSNVDAQGLIKGEKYRVVDWKSRRTFLGGFTTVFVRPVDRSIDLGIIAVGNAHLVLSEVGS